MLDASGVGARVMVLEGGAGRVGGEEARRDFGLMMMMMLYRALAHDIPSLGLYVRLGIGRGCVGEA